MITSNLTISSNFICAGSLRLPTYIHVCRQIWGRADWTHVAYCMCTKLKLVVLVVQYLFFSH